MSTKHSVKPPAHIAVSLHPEIFYALQSFAAAGGQEDARWNPLLLRALPPKRWPVTLPGIFWAAIPDVLEIEPTPDFAAVLQALEDAPAREFQERILSGILHERGAALAFLDDGTALNEVAASLPRVKREWLGHVGLYPVDPLVEDTMDRLRRSPEEFRSDVVAMVAMFWDRVFATVWDELKPGLDASVERMTRLYEQCTFPEFLRHTLLPVELNTSRNALRALRGGYELPLPEISRCTFTPSVFNDGRYWTTYSVQGAKNPWFAYIEPNLRPSSFGDEESSSSSVPDIALIFRALGDSTRYAIASLIGHQPRSAAELAQTLSVSRPTVTHHLHIMRSAGLIHETDHGGSTLISLNAVILGQMSALATRALLESREPITVTRSRRTS